VETQKLNCSGQRSFVEEAALASNEPRRPRQTMLIAASFQAF